MTRPVSSTTSITDLNEDCLREVFEHLDADELSEVADTCKRFRSVAQETFRTSKLKTVDVWIDVDVDEKLQLGIFRNFGRNIEKVSIYSAFDHCLDKLYEYMSRYCGTELRSLELRGLDISDESTYKLQPALRYLQNLELERCDLGPMLLSNLPSLSPNLRDLKFCATQLDRIKPALIHHFPELQCIDFEEVSLVMSIDDLEVFLQLNPQLKRIRYDNVDCIFRIVATHLPGIEHLDVASYRPENVAYLNQLRSLKSLFLFQKPDTSIKPPGIESEIEKLTLYNFDFRGVQTELTQLKNLRELDLLFPKNLTETHINGVLVECSQLGRLMLLGCDGLKFSTDNLLDILRYGEALKCFKYVSRERVVNEEDKIIIDADSYMKMVNIVNTRPVAGMKMELEALLGRQIYSNKIPDALLAEHRNKLDLRFT